VTTEFLHIASTVSGVFLVMAMGALARYLKWFTSEVDRSLAGFLSNVLLPSFFFYRIMTDTKLSTNISAWTPSLFGFGLTVFGFLLSAWIAFLIGRQFHLESNPQKRAFALCSGIANYGYIPFPLAEVFYPGCVVTLLVHNVGVDIALWSVGLYIISGVGLKKSWKRIVFSPPLLSVAIALGIRQLGWGPWIPRPLLSMTDQLGRCSIPIGLVLGGAIIFDCIPKIRIRSAWLPLMLSISVRMLLLPCLFLCIAKYGGLPIELQQVLLLQAAMPAATFPIVMTQLYNQNVETACTIVVGTSLTGLVTIPIWMVLGARFLGF
jgi:malate permease and related proteins